MPSSCRSCAGAAQSSDKSILADSPTARGAVGQVLSFPAFGPITGKRKKKNPAFFFSQFKVLQMPLDRLQISRNQI